MKRNNGFSLIEIIIVIAIMAILIAIIAPNLTKYLGKSKKRTDEKNAEETAYQLHNCITDYETEVGTLIDDPDVTLRVDWDPSLSYYTSPRNTVFDRYINEVVTAHTASKEDNSYAYAIITRRGPNIEQGYNIVVTIGSMSVKK